MMEAYIVSDLRTRTENSNENILTLRNMPWLDIGDLPQSYERTKSEAF